MAENANGSCCPDSGQLIEINAFIDELAAKGSLDGKLISILHKTQEILGYLPVEAQAHVARRLGIPPAKVYGVVSFYSFFSMVPKGKYVIDVCMGTACFVLGADKILDEFGKVLGIEPGQTTDDRLFSLIALRCVGACGLAPVAIINGKMYGKLTKESVTEVIEMYKGGGVE